MPPVPRLPPFDRRATYEDLVNLPTDLVGEIIDGELHASPSPAPGMAGSANALGGMLLRGVDRSGGPDSWQILPGPELHLGADVLAPGLAGWRLSRLPGLPATPYFSVPPDWVCEIFSSSPAAFRARKMSIYASAGVAHAWLIDPVAHTLEVRRVDGDRWRVVGTHVGDQTVQVEPFDTLELPLAALWPRASAERRPKRR